MGHRSQRDCFGTPEGGWKQRDGGHMYIVCQNFYQPLIPYTSILGPEIL